MTEAVGYSCTVCARVSYNPTDVAEGYCAACHTWTRGCTCIWERRPDGSYRHLRYNDQCTPHMGWRRGEP